MSDQEICTAWCYSVVSGHAAQRTPETTGLSCWHWSYSATCFPSSAPTELRSFARATTSYHSQRRGQSSSQEVQRDSICNSQSKALIHKMDLLSALLHPNPLSDISQGSITCPYSDKTYTWSVQFDESGESDGGIPYKGARVMADTISMLRWCCTCPAGPESKPHDICLPLPVETEEDTHRLQATREWLEEYCRFLSEEGSYPVSIRTASDALHQ